ncbi:response regulator transcription factor [Granulosicoccaceae sp. 1_MG-2023]|nr:response regulator transcription factor [Granulosicoccaceae sp. 1_MG-2023]
MTKVLLADDDQVLAEMLSDYLSAEEFEVSRAANGVEAVEQAMQQQFDIIVLDVMMPEKSGFDALREIRTKQSTPVLMLTARGDDIDRIVGLEMGADDYLPKPCNPRELVARIRAILRRTQNVPGERSMFSLDGIELCTSDRTVTLDGEALPLTSTEFNILETLISGAGHVIEKNDLTQQAMGRRLAAYDRSLDMHISNLRRKLGNRADGSERIKTVRGVGYLYTMPAPART